MPHGDFSDIGKYTEIVFATISHLFDRGGVYDFEWFAANVHATV